MGPAGLDNIHSDQVDLVQMVRMRYPNGIDEVLVSDQQGRQ